MSKTVNKSSNKPNIPAALMFVFRLVKKEKPMLYLWYFLQLISEIGTTVLPIILPKYIFEFLIAITQGTSYEEVKYKLVGTVGLLIGFTLLGNCIVKVTTAIRTTTNEWFNRYLEQTVAERAMNMDFEHTESPDALDQLNKAKDGIAWYSGGVEGILSNFYKVVLNFCVLICGSALVIRECPWLMVIQAAGLLTSAFFNVRINRAEIKSFKDASVFNRRFSYFFYQVSNFNYGKDIRLYNSADMFSERGKKENGKLLNVWKKQAFCTMRNFFGINFCNTFRDSASYLYLGVLAISKRITVGDFTMYCAASSAFYWAVYRILEGVQEVVKRSNYIAEYFAFMQYPSVMPKGTESVAGQEHTIEFRDVSFKYPRSEKYVLRHVNLTIKPGEHLSIVGLNGAGKTTFIKLLCRLYDVSEGEILLDGKNIKSYSDGEYRKIFSPVFQDFQLFAFTLKENVALANVSGEEEVSVNQALELSGVYNDVVKLERGIDTIIYKSFDENGTELSGGQKQKVAISRALYKDAPVVILDEPTAALDPVAEYEIYRKFNELVGGKTAIYISHRLSSCKFCDRIAVFAEDGIKEYGTHDELVMKSNGIYAEMFAAQAQYYV
ncbi:MAG: ABC transporter ATP-binding protein [Lachnospiraceae bacterium]|nr:ABC transporter ATP-binding protein [Lachnospiraceae bacterium]